MKYFVKLFVIIIFLFNSNLVYAEQTVAFIDIDKIMRQSKAGKSISKQLENLLSQNTKKYKKIQDNLKEDELKTKSQKKRI